MKNADGTPTGVYFRKWIPRLDLILPIMVKKQNAYATCIQATNMHRDWHWTGRATEVPGYHTPESHLKQGPRTGLDRNVKWENNSPSPGGNFPPPLALASEMYRKNTFFRVREAKDHDFGPIFFSIFWNFLNFCPKTAEKGVQNVPNWLKNGRISG